MCQNSEKSVAFYGGIFFTLLSRFRPRGPSRPPPPLRWAGALPVALWRGGGCWSARLCQRVYLCTRNSTLSVPIRTYPYRPECTQVAVGTGGSRLQPSPFTPKNISHRQVAHITNYPGRRQATHLPARPAGGNIAPLSASFSKARLRECTTVLDRSNVRRKGSREQARLPPVN